MCLLTWVAQFDPFFWDTVQLGSKHAHYFFENGLQWAPLPTAIDSGHPPVFGYYLALCWTYFGKSLLVSHWAMLPFLLLNVLMLWRIGIRIAGDFWGCFLPLLVLCDPVLLGQSVMISPDLVLVTGFLLAIEGVLSKRWTLLMVGAAILCAISMRGMMTAAAIAAWTLILILKAGWNIQKLSLRLWPFLPGFFFGAWFLWWHWQAVGWLGYHGDSPWAGAFQRVGPLGFLRNILIVGWRWLDFGRFGEWLFLFAMLYAALKKYKPKAWLGQLTESPIRLLLLCLLVFLLPSALMYQNLSAHRYFLPTFIALHFVVIELLPEIKARISRWLLPMLVFLLLSGNLWVYPRTISMDWDSTLAHWPYHQLRQEALAFLEDKDIDFKEVGSAFPNLNTGEHLLLNGDQRQFSPLDFEKNRYVLASNIFNDISEADYTRLENQRQLLWEQRRGGVWMAIYARYNKILEE